MVHHFNDLAKSIESCRVVPHVTKKSFDLLLYWLKQEPFDLLLYWLKQEPFDLLLYWLKQEPFESLCYHLHKPVKVPCIYLSIQNHHFFSFFFPVFPLLVVVLYSLSYQVTLSFWWLSSESSVSKLIPVSLVEIAGIVFVYDVIKPLQSFLLDNVSDFIWYSFSCDSCKKLYSLEAIILLVFCCLLITSFFSIYSYWYY